MKKYRRIVPSALALALLCTGAALAANGDKSDPLVTLSYLEQTALPGVVSQVETKAAQRQTDMRHVNAPASPGNRRFHGLLPERNERMIGRMPVSPENL